ncbi:MAG: hypothetical protein R3E36_12370 [Nitrosomonas sp.]|nr:hypothetical protein [Burkholderiales bacterium]MCP5291916.1 hypothetical protein [Burkholderiales bacterium]MDR4521366.1 hypothetical protein [Nitrosomonas sp.]
MEEFVAWVIKNKDWLFSGAGVVVVVWMLRFIFKKTFESSSQTIHSGNSSTNIQAGRDVNIRTKRKKSDVEDE